MTNMAFHFRSVSDALQRRKAFATLPEEQKDSFLKEAADLLNRIEKATGKEPMLLMEDDSPQVRCPDCEDLLLQSSEYLFGGDAFVVGLKCPTCGNFWKGAVTLGGENDAPFSTDTKEEDFT